MDPGLRVLGDFGRRYGVWPRLPALREARRLQLRGALRALALPGVPARERLLVVGAVRSGSLRVGFLGALMLVFVMPPETAAAQREPFARAERARAEGLLDEAESAFEAALESGRLDPSEVAHAHLRLAELAYLAQASEEGARHLRWALALRPDAPVQDEALPEAMRVEAASVLAARDGALRAVLEVSGPDASVRLHVRDAPEGMVRVVEVAAGEWSRTLAWDDGPVDLEPPAAARAQLSVRVLDAHGNELARAGLAPPAPVDEPAEPAPIELAEIPASEPEENLIESPWLWVVIGAVLIGVGTGIGLSASGRRYIVGAPVAP